MEPVAPNQLPAAPTVQPGGSGVTVYADYSTIVSMATRYRELVYGYNSSGYEAYGRIMTSYQMVSTISSKSSIHVKSFHILDRNPHSLPNLLYLLVSLKIFETLMKTGQASFIKTVFILIKLKFTLYNP